MEELTLRQYRMAKEISKETMAKALNIHVNTYTAWENDPLSNISIKNGLEIARLLNEPFEAIFLHKNSKKEDYNGRGKAKRWRLGS